MLKDKTRATQFSRGRIIGRRPGPHSHGGYVSIRPPIHRFRRPPHHG
jgi:hypothetical protein